MTGCGGQKSTRYACRGPGLPLQLYLVSRQAKQKPRRVADVVIEKGLATRGDELHPLWDNQH